MGKKIFFLLTLFITLLTLNIFLTRKIYQKANKETQIKRILNEISHYNPEKQFTFLNAPQVLGSFHTQATLSDNRVANLKNFFRKHNSILFDYAELIVYVSDKYHFDYRLLPAIAMQESTLCRNILANSHNCWGWGIYGGKITKFYSYEEAIETVAKGIKKYYLDKGLITASSIMQKYNPSSDGSWQRGVNTFLRMLE